MPGTAGGFWKTVMAFSLCGYTDLSDADKLASTKLKDDGTTVAVSGGTATLTGTVKIGGHKGNATQFAKRCGATTVTNNITVESAPKTKAKK